MNQTPKDIFSEQKGEISALESARNLVRWLESIERENPTQEQARVKNISILTCANLISERALKLKNTIDNG